MIRLAGLHLHFILAVSVRHYWLGDQGSCHEIECSQIDRRYWHFNSQDRCILISAAHLLVVV